MFAPQTASQLYLLLEQYVLMILYLPKYCGAFLLNNFLSVAKPERGETIYFFRTS
jgi:hypothetical protein